MTIKGIYGKMVSNPTTKIKINGQMDKWLENPVCCFYADFNALVTFLIKAQINVFFNLPHIVSTLCIAHTVCVPHSTALHSAN